MATLPALTAVLEAGGEVVTATAPQARALGLRLARERAARGERVFHAPAVRPFGAWLLRAAERIDDRPALVTPYVASRLWRRVVADSVAGADLVSPAAAAQGAQEAWRRLAEHDLTPAALAPATPEQAAFGAWLEAYLGLLDAAGALDRARLPARVADAGATALGGGGPVAFYGFATRTPARRRLLAALAAAGRTVVECSVDEGPATLLRAAAPTPELELEWAVDWLAVRLAAAPGARLALIVPDLAARAAPLARLLEDRLAPALKSPAAPAAGPFVLSGQGRLADEGIVQTALRLLAVGGSAEVDVLELGRLLRSPYAALGGDPAAAGAGLTARFDLALRELGPRRLPFEAVLEAARRGPFAASALASTLARLRTALAGPARVAHAWADAWPRALRAAGWPGPRPLGAREDAAARALVEAFAGFAALGRWLAPLAGGAARAELAALIAAEPFEPAAAEAAVLVLERHEDAALPLDGLWVAGLSADRFPAAAAPSPFLPLALQRAQAMPGASPELTLAAAQATLAGWQRAAPELVLSHALADGDTRRLPAALLPAAAPYVAPARGVRRAAEVRAAARREPWRDGDLPPLAAGLALQGGVRALEEQSRCPFRAAARLRLGARVPASPGPGLPRTVRGELVHAALAEFWRTLRSHAALVALPPGALAARAGAAVDAAFAAHRGYLPGGRLRVLERRWLERAIVALATIETGRAPFTVEACEAREAVTLGGRALQVRLDRLDRLADGGTVVLDYKSGASGPRRWAGPRSDALQLAVYAATRPEPPVAVALVHLPLRLDARKKFRGVAARAGLLPAVQPPGGRAAFEGLDWPGLLEDWRRTSERLAVEHAAGVATVDPAAGACEHCELVALCRIRVPAVVAEEEPEAAGEAGAATVDGDEA